MRPRRSGSCGGPEADDPGGALTWQLQEGARATALREAVAGCDGVRAVLFPPPEGVPRATPTSRLCTLHNRADVTEKLSLPPTQNPGKAGSSGVAAAPAVTSLCTLWRSQEGNPYFGVEGWR